MTADLSNDHGLGADDADEQLIAALDHFDAELDTASTLDPTTTDSLDDGLRPEFRRLSVLLMNLARLREAGAATSHPDTAEAVADEPPPKIGRFEVVRELGRGGHGIVFLALDGALGRQVALKVPRPELLFAHAARERFLREGRSTASLSHPNLITVFEAGEAGSVCYLAQEYCDGPNLDEWMRRRPGPVAPRLAAALVAQLAEGIEHAHRRGVVHRDLKPGNVLMQSRSPAADSAGATAPVRAEEEEWTPRIVDFGLARLAEGQAALTATGAMLGTPAFMAPEQLDSHHGAVGASSDTYALGGILYQLLTGRPPFAGASQSELIKHVLLDPPRGVRLDHRVVPKDLEAICLHALEKEPRRRYATAADLAADLRRFLSGEPTLVRPLGPVGRSVRWARRQPWAAGLVLTASMAIAAIVAVLLWSNVQLSRAYRAAREQERLSRAHALESRQRAYASDMRLLDDNQVQMSASQADRTLDEYRPQPGDPDLRGFDWWVHWHRYHSDVPSRVIGHHEGGVASAAVALSGEIAATGGNDGFIRVWSLPGGQPVREIQAHQGAVNALAFQARSDRLVSAGDDAAVRVWDASQGVLVKDLRGHADWVATLQILPNGRLASGAADGEIIVWDFEAGKPVARLTGHTKPVRSLALHRPTNLLVSASEDATIRVWDVERLQPWNDAGDNGLPNPLAPRWVRQLAFEPDQQTLCGVYSGQAVVHWRTGSRFGEVRSLFDTEAATRCVTFAGIPRDPEMVVGLANGTILRTKPAHLDDHLQRLRGAASSVEAVALSSDGKQLVSGSRDGEVRHWPDIVTNQRVMRSPWTTPSSRLALSRSGDWLALTTDDALKIVDFASLRPVYQFPMARPKPEAILFDPQESGVAVVYSDEVHWQPLTSERQAMPLDVDFEAAGGVFDEPSGLLALFGRGGVLVVGRNPLTVVARLPHPQRVGGLAFLPESRLVTASTDGLLRMFADLTKAATQTGDLAADSLVDVCLSPNGQMIAVRAERQVVVVDAKSLGILGSLPQLGEGGRLAFLAGGKTLVTQNFGGLNRLWSVANLQPTGRFMELDEITDLAASADGWRLVALTEEELLRVDATPN